MRENQCAHSYQIFEVILPKNYRSYEKTSLHIFDVICREESIYIDTFRIRLRNIFDTARIT